MLIPHHLAVAIFIILIFFRDHRRYIAEYKFGFLASGLVDAGQMSYCSVNSNTDSKK